MVEEFRRQITQAGFGHVYGDDYRRGRYGNGHEDLTIEQDGVDVYAADRNSPRPFRAKWTCGHALSWGSFDASGNPVNGYSVDFKRNLMDGSIKDKKPRL